MKCNPESADQYTLVKLKEVERVTRTVVQLLPVLSRSWMMFRSRPQPIALRWHTKVPADQRDDGTLVVSTERAKLIVRLIDVNETTARDAKVEISTHRYSPLFDRSRNGEPLVQRNESFLMARHHGKSVKYLTLFAVTESAALLTIELTRLRVVLV